MSTTKSRVSWALALIAIIAGAYLLGRRGGGPLAKLRAQSPSTDSAAAVASLRTRCGKMSGGVKSACLEAALDSMASRGEVRLAMRTLANLAKGDPDVVRDGHLFAHGIGMAAGKGGGDIAKIFAQCDESNQSGCYHGVLQSYLIAAKHVGATEVNAVCEPFRGPNADRWLLFQCVHGTGHGLTMYYDHDMPRALKDCDYLSGGWDKQSCWAGVFMENIVNAEMPKNMKHSHDGMAGMSGMSASKWKPLDRNDLLYPCSVMEAKYLASCYEMQTAAILFQNGGDIAAAAKTCDTAPNLMRYVCYQSLGRDISAYALQDHARATKMCEMGTPKYRPWCYFGLVKSFVNMDARASDGLVYCKELTGVPDKLKCYEAVGEQIGTLRNTSVERSSLCQPAEPTYLGACLYGARVEMVEPPGLAKLNGQPSRDEKSD